MNSTGTMHDQMTGAVMIVKNFASRKIAAHEDFLSLRCCWAMAMLLEVNACSPESRSRTSPVPGGFP